MTTWNNKEYYTTDSTQWTGRSDTLPNERIFNFVKCVDISTTSLSTLEFDRSLLQIGIIGFCCDEGIKRNQGRAGAQQGPQALRQNLCNLSTANFTNKIQLWDFGDIRCSDQNLESSQRALGDLVNLLISHNIIPLVLGGGHETAWGHYQGMASTHIASNLGIVNLDAHFDMRNLLPEQKGSSGTPFLQIALDRKNSQLSFDYYCLGIQSLGNTKDLFDAAKQWNVQYILAEEIHSQEKQSYTTSLEKFLNHHENIYLSICLDVFAAAFAPGVSAPQPYGITPSQGVEMLKKIIFSKKVRSIDIVELSPVNDLHQMTAKLGANLIGQILSLVGN